MSRHIIPYSKARSLISAYLSDTTINAIKNGTSLGGSVDRKALESKPPYIAIPGIRFWICYDLETTPPQLFASAEKTAIEYSDIGNFDTMKSILNAPSGGGIFHYKSADISNAAIDEFLSNKQNFLLASDRILPKNFDPKTDQPGVTDYVNTFLAHFPKQKDGASYNPIGVSFYDDLDFDIETFLQQKNSAGEQITHVRYVFGIEQSDVKLDYPLRMVLFGVDSDGSTLIGENAIILEKGWPPRLP